MRQQYLTKDEVRRKAPLVFSESPTREVSSKYVFANTEVVMDDMALLGWFPTDAGQRAPRNPLAPSRFSPHMVKFGNPDMVIRGEDGDTNFPQIILMNRHDGLGSFKFMAGIYRFVCSNGLVIATSEFASMSIRHQGYTFDELREVVQKRVEVLPEQVEIMNKMKQVTLSLGEKRKLALDGLLLRSGIDPTSSKSEEFEADEDLLTQMILPTREEDKSNDLWSSFNVIQEKVVKGGLKIGKRRTKALSSFEKDIELNSKLFSRAVELIP